MEINRLGMKETIKRIIPLIILSFAFIIFSVFMYNKYITLDRMGNILIESIAAGVIEELVFRKLILGKMLEKKPKKYLQSIIITAGLFGLIHLINLTSSEYNLLSVIIQVVSASVAGIMFGLMYYHSRSYLLCAATHSLYDIGAFMTMLRANNLYATTFDIPSELIIIAIIGLIIRSFFIKNKKRLIITNIMCIVLIVLYLIII